QGMKTMANKRAVAKEANIGTLEKAINAKYGDGTITRANNPTLKIRRIPCGVLSVDFILGGGFPCGRHTEIYGGYSLGKTYLAYRLIASAQESGVVCSFIDVEGTFDPEFSQHTGVDLGELAYHRQEHGNRCVDYMEVQLRSKQ